MSGGACAPRLWAVAMLWMHPQAARAVSTAVSWNWTAIGTVGLAIATSSWSGTRSSAPGAIAGIPRPGLGETAPMPGGGQLLTALTLSGGCRMSAI